MHNKPTISAIKANMLPLVWFEVKPMIQAAVDHSNGELDIDQIKERLLKKEMLLLTVSREDNIVAALTLEVRHFPSGMNILNITTAGGSELHLWMKDVDKVIDDLALQHNCEEVYIVGRPGWEKLLKTQGYNKIHTVVSRKVGDL